MDYVLAEPVGTPFETKFFINDTLTKVGLHNGRRSCYIFVSGSGGF